MSAKLYLLPTTLGESEINAVLPSTNNEICSQLKHYIVEDVRTARRFLKKVDKTIDIDSIQFYVLNKHTTAEELSTFLKPLVAGFDMGYYQRLVVLQLPTQVQMWYVWLKKKYTSSSLVGPSSIILSLMASGFNGQNFAFNGYLPIQDDERIAMLKN